MVNVLYISKTYLELKFQGGAKRRYDNFYLLTIGDGEGAGSLICGGGGRV